MRHVLTPKVRTKSISEAHRWARRKGFFGRRKPRVEFWIVQVALEGAVHLPEPERYQRTSLDDPYADAPNVWAVSFPDGSVVWWDDDEELWGLTDPDGVDTQRAVAIVHY